MTHPFTREYVEGLRREGQRKGVRIRDLEEALIVKAIDAEALRQGVPPEMVGKISILGVYVDDRGIVVGAAEAVCKVKPKT
jgi:hypothetical protein